MKLELKTNNVETFNTKRVNDFTIKQTAKTFEILSSSLYSDKILAVVRELSCNALDAHISLNKRDVPFYIHVPTILEPFFSIRDYGTGLSKDAILGEEVVYITTDGETRTERKGGLYTTYFDSTKSHSNDYIGALGLGSKSPFCYSPTFNVISYFNGTKTLYIAFINEEGFPSILEQSEVETTEENGLEVIVPIQKTSDYNTFIEKIKYVFEFFPVEPITNTTILYHTDKEPIFEVKDKFALYKTSNSHTYSIQCCVVQGCVKYPLDLHKIKSQEFLKEFVRNFGRVVLFFDIGEINITASRENIEYKDRTIEVIIKRLEEMVHFYSNSVILSIIKENRKSLWNTIKCLSKYGSSTFIYSILKRITTDEDDIRNIINKLISKSIKNVFEINTTELVGFSVYHNVYYKNTKRMLSKDEKFAETLMPVILRTVYYNDLKKGRDLAITSHASDAYKDHVVIHLLPAYNKNDASVKEELKHILNILGNPPLVYTSEIEIKKEISESKKNIISVKKFNASGGNRNRFVVLRMSKKDFEEGGYYLEIEGSTNKVIFRSNLDMKRQGDSLNTYMKFIEVFFKIELPKLNNVIYVSKNNINRFKNHDKWINLTDTLQEKAAVSLFFIRDIAMLSDDMSGDFPIMKKILADATLADKLKGTYFYNTIKELLKYSSSISNEIRSLLRFANGVSYMLRNNILPKEDEPKELKEYIYNELETNYPLLFTESRTYSNKEPTASYIEDAIIYIKQKEAVK